MAKRNGKHAGESVSANGHKRAILYARVSTDEQAEHGYSLKSQLAAGRKYAEHSGFTVVADYIDGGVSGELPMDCRPKGREMLDALKRHEAEAVIVYTADRLSRNLAHSLVLRQQWQRAGVELHYADRGKLQDTPEGRLSQNVEAVIAEYEREKIRARTMGGKRDKVKAGKWLGVHTPFGYRREGRGREAQLFICEPEAATVRQIFDWYLRGDESSVPLSVSEICARLEARGILPPDTQKGNGHNRKWSRASLRQMLRNEIYAGRIYYGKTRLAPKEYDTQKLWERERPVPREQWITVPLPALAIIDPDTFGAAQKRAERNRAMANRQRCEYMLSGFLRCGHCNWAMGGQKHTKHKKDGTEYTQYFYRCPNPECPANKTNTVSHALDDLVKGWLLEETSDPERLRRGVKKMAEEREAELEPNRERLATLDELIAEQEKVIKRLSVKFSQEKNEKLAEAVYEQMQTAGKSLDSMNSERSLLLAGMARREMTEAAQERLIKMALAIGRRLRGKPSVSQRRALFEAVELQVKFWRLKERRPVKINWAIGPETTRYLGEPCLPSTGSEPCSLRARAR